MNSNNAIPNKKQHLSDHSVGFSGRYVIFKRIALKPVTEALEVVTWAHASILRPYVYLNSCYYFFLLNTWPFPHQTRSACRSAAEISSTATPSSEHRRCFHHVRQSSTTRASLIFNKYWSLCRLLFAIVMCTQTEEGSHYHEPNTEKIFRKFLTNLLVLCVGVLAFQNIARQTFSVLISEVRSITCQMNNGKLSATTDLSKQVGTNFGRLSQSNSVSTWPRISSPIARRSREPFCCTKGVIMKI